MLAGRLSPGAGISTVSLDRNTTVANTLRIGWAKLTAVYWLAGVGSGKPQSHAGARRTAGDAKRWMTATVSRIEAVMKAKTRRPLYELRLASIGTIESQAPPICVGIL